jgi:hypothetical protein
MDKFEVLNTRLKEVSECWDMWKKKGYFYMFTCDYCYEVGNNIIKEGEYLK